MANPTTSIFLNGSTPAAPSGDQNVTFQSDNATPQQSVTAYPQRATATSYGTMRINDLQQESFIYAADTGAANAYAVTLSPAPTIVAGSVVVFKAANANTGASTLAVNGGTATAIKKNVSVALASGDIAAGQIISVVYDGTNWQMVGASALANSGVTAGSYTNANVTVNAQGIVTAASNGSAGAGVGLIQLIQYATSTGTTCSFAHNVQKGSTVIVEWVGNSTTPTFSDNQSNVYTVRNSITWATVTTTPSQAYALNVAAGALTVTASTTGVINIYEYSNVDSVEAYNGATYDGSTGLPGSGTLATGNVTTTIPQDVIHMTGMGNAGSGVTLTNAGSWPSIQTVANIPTAVTIESWYTTESVSGTFSNTLSYAGIPSGGSGHAYAAILALKPRAIQQSPGFTLTTTGTSGAATLTGTTLNVPNYTGGGGGNYVLLESHSASNSASLDFTASISSTYNVYEIVFVNLVPATSGAAVSLRMSTNGGSSYDSGSNYSYSFGVWVPAGPGSGGSNATTQLQLAGTSNADAAYSASGTVRLYSPLSSSAYKNVVGTMFSIDTTADGRKSEVWTCGGSYLSTTAVNAIRVLFSSGNITSGTVRIYGIN